MSGFAFVVLVGKRQIVQHIAPARNPDELGKFSARGWSGPANWHFSTRKGIVSIHAYAPAGEQWFYPDPDGALWWRMWQLACALVGADPAPYQKDE